MLSMEVIAMNIKESLLNTLAAANGDYISGAALAESLGVSRNAVWKAVKSLEAEGYTIESVTSKGYRLAESNNRLSEKLIAAHLKTTALGRELQVLDEVDSTNIAAKKLAANGAPHGTAVVADRQTMGRGRLGRTFVSPSGTGIYLSVIVRPEFRMELVPMITTAASVAVAEAVEKLCGMNTQIKWVNDVYLGGKKICGILTEASLGLEMKSIDYAVIGIGVNVRSIHKEFGEELSNIATSIYDETGIAVDRNILCAEILNALESYIVSLPERRFLPEYRRRELLTGNEITASVSGQQLSGMAVGIDDNANLIVNFPDGTVKHLSSGEASLCRIKK